MLKKEEVVVSLLILVVLCTIIYNVKCNDGVRDPVGKDNDTGVFQAAPDVKVLDDCSGPTLTFSPGGFEIGSPEPTDTFGITLKGEEVLTFYGEDGMWVMGNETEPSTVPADTIPPTRRR